MNNFARNHLYGFIQLVFTIFTAKHGVISDALKSRFTAAELKNKQQKEGGMLNCK